MCLVIFHSPADDSCNSLNRTSGHNSSFYYELKVSAETGSFLRLVQATYTTAFGDHFIPRQI